MKRLELGYKISQLSVFHREETALWNSHNTELKIEHREGNIFGYFRTWEDKVEPEMIKDEWKKLEERAESFLLAMRFMGNRKIDWEKISLYFHLDDKQFFIKNDTDIECIIRYSKGEKRFTYVHMEVPGLIFSGEARDPLPLPKKMPRVPLNLRSLILTIIQAEELDDYKEGCYKDEQLKRWFLVLEELESMRNSSDYRAIQYLRNFVSHPTIGDPNVIKFLESELPSSVYLNSTSKKEARFLRDDSSHMALISKYENKARQRARELVKQEIEKHGGNVNWL